MSSPSAQIRVIAVDAATGRQLRMAVLRPDEPPDRQMYPREADVATLHFAAIDADAEVLSVASAMPEGHPLDPRASDWRVRGMATRAEQRGRGLGGEVLAMLEAAARGRGAARLWCYARTGAQAFYQRAGFAREGEEFEIEGIGAHVLMSKPLA